MIGTEEIFTVDLISDIERYGSIADRWPSKITITGTKKQLAYFEINGVYEAGCTDLFYPSDDNSERIMSEAMDEYFKDKKSK